MHIRLLRHHEAHQNPVIKILRGLGVPDQHAGLEQVIDLERIGLNAERRIDAAAGHDHFNRQAGAGPHGEILHGPHRAGAGRRREDAGAAKGPAGAFRHHPELILSAHIVGDIAFGVELADQSRGFTLRRNRVGDHQVHAGPPNRFLDDLASGIEGGNAWGFEEQMVRISVNLPLLVFCADDGMAIHQFASSSR